MNRMIRLSYFSFEIQCCTHLNPQTKNDMTLLNAVELSGSAEQRVSSDLGVPFFVLSKLVGEGQFLGLRGDQANVHQDVQGCLPEIGNRLTVLLLQGLVKAHKPGQESQVEVRSLQFAKIRFLNWQLESCNLEQCSWRRELKGSTAPFRGYTPGIGISSTSSRHSGRVAVKFALCFLASARPASAPCFLPNSVLHSLNKSSIHCGLSRQCEGASSSAIRDTATACFEHFRGLERTAETKLQTKYNEQ